MCSIAGANDAAHRGHGAGCRAESRHGDPGTWWDTFAGVAISNLHLPHGRRVTNAAAVQHAGHFALGARGRRCPHRRPALSAPGLVQTLGTNSPALTVPVTIGNGSGLPLGYSAVPWRQSKPGELWRGQFDAAGRPVAYGLWQDISSPGARKSPQASPVTVINKTAKDEGIAGPINIGLAFPFFTNTFYATLRFAEWICDLHSLQRRYFDQYVASQKHRAGQHDFVLLDGT